MDRCQDKAAVVTGGTSGIGLATAELLVAEGAQVLVTGRGGDSLQRAVGRLGPSASGMACDATSVTDLEALAEHVSRRFGRIDLLFVNAGLTSFVPVGDMTADVFDEVFALNARGAYFTVQKLAPALRHGAGVVLTTSVAGVKGLSGSSAYAASKAAVRSMTRSFARELLPEGVRINAVSPGPIDTGILERALPDVAANAARAQMEANNPMGRFGRSEEVAKAVLFLGLEATYCTGCELPVDGGASQL